MRTPSLGVRLLLIAACGLGAPISTLGTLRAAPGAPTSVESIRRYMEKGQALFLAGESLKAAELFEAGYEFHPYSAFLFNAGVAREKAARLEEALANYRKYLEVDAKAPDRAEVERRIAALEQKLLEQKHAAESPSSKPAPITPPREELATKSLLLVETEPVGAPLHVYRRTTGELPFSPGQANPDWVEVAAGEAPANLTLDVGKYYVLVDKWKDFNGSGADVEVSSGHVHQVKISLSQGEFAGLLSVATNVARARVYLDDPKRKLEPWARGPHSGLVASGDHELLVEALGYAPVRRKVHLDAGAKAELKLELERVNYGSLWFDSNSPELTVWLDGREVGHLAGGSPPLLLEKVPAGPHRLRCETDGRKPVESELLVPRGQVLPVYSHMVPTPPRGAAWTQAAIATVLLGGGIYVGLESNRLHDELAADRSAGVLESGDSRKTRGKVYAIAADISFVGAAVLGGLATYSFLRDPLPPSRIVTEAPREFDAPAPSSNTEVSPAKKRSGALGPRSRSVPLAALRPVPAPLSAERARFHGRGGL